MMSKGVPISGERGPVKKPCKAAYSLAPEEIAVTGLPVDDAVVPCCRAVHGNADHYGTLAVPDVAQTGLILLSRSWSVVR